MVMTYVKMETSQGTINIELYTKDCPETTSNFLRLVDEGFYDGLHFHRIIKDFMIQGGCPKSKDPESRAAGTGGPGWQIPCESTALAKKHNKPGLFSMANAGPNTGGSQFFLTTVPTPWLDGNHAVFGEVVKGMDIVQKIENQPTNFRDKPDTPQKIISIKREIE
jgi:cyclophilin family peptidyl-prolyl cis-trans isomerase